MTTVLIDKRVGLIVTDSKVTCYNTKSVLGVKLQKFSHTWVANQKAIYLHDRLYLGSGDVEKGLNKLLNALINKDDLNKLTFDKGVSFTACLVDKNWVLFFKHYKGVLKRKFYILGKYSRWAFGSGCHHLIECFDLKDRGPHHTLRCFSKVKFFDRATDDNLNIYRI